MEYVFINGELYHHGILGQKWGKRNGPPYPLKESAHSASEKKAGWKKSLDKSKDDDLAERQVHRGRSIAKKILLGAGMLALGAALSEFESNYGAELFNPEVYKKALMLQYSGNKDKKLYVDGQVIIPRQEYKRVISAITSNLSTEMRKADSFTFHLDDRVYICENRKNDIPKIINWFEQHEWDEALWEERHGK